VGCEPKEDSLTVHVDRSKIISKGKPALGQMLLKLHMYRSTADVEACRTFYEALSKVDGESLEWRRIVLAKKQPKWIYVQANTFLGAKGVILKEYEESNEGIIQSWAERAV
jgi:dipeptidyl-peptidase III